MDIDRHWSLIREWGVLTYATYHLVSAFNRIGFFQIIVGVVLRPESVTHELLRCDSRFSMELLPAKNLLPWSGDPAYDLPSSFIADAAKRGDQCLCIFEGSSLVSYGWYSSAPTSVAAGLDVSFDPSFMYMYKGFTLPSHRGMRLHALGMGSALERFAASGTKGLLAYVDGHNFNSLKSVRRLGYQEFGRLYVWRAFGRYRWISTGQCEKYKFALQETTATQAKGTPCPSMP